MKCDDVATHVHQTVASFGVNTSFFFVFSFLSFVAAKIVLPDDIPGFLPENAVLGRAAMIRTKGRTDHFVRGNFGCYWVSQKS
jgi:hypothetical protein